MEEQRGNAKKTLPTDAERKTVKRTISSAGQPDIKRQEIATSWLMPCTLCRATAFLFGLCLVRIKWGLLAKKNVVKIP